MRNEAKTADKNDPNSRKSDQIRERFEDRFKRQLKNLTDDASNIIKTRLSWLFIEYLSIFILLNVASTYWVNNYQIG